ncbi:hypothetical protein HUN03_00414 [Mycoplasmopsis anatis]|uniref:Uncharacterized protein n=2 Tax=Mycoplasmopsis anatis TaxID=171279 RepID=F9QCP8_9BACT|nr:hypothetical protein [Mycoplasmopsis anatis]AWX70023.1 hypothetical protein DP067_01410 [Mycoplasmopsis anatis]EGS29465.1 hypothetical protein GIG_01022 [Mycoplasmopsis anatis 1340]MBW0594485.1 hypothetical protein [Mycoplasmopsis anatis]MBW0595222.1 hypothetical protein [Mycoplasmopsis anatis]MBW0596425.1 hypothetical protein [Mycoplasmopsis anatis]
MNYYKKLKRNLSKREFYLYVTGMSFVTFVSVFWIVSFFVFPISKPENIDPSLSKDQLIQGASKYLNNFALSKILSYIANSLILIFFLIYVWLLRGKISCGYGFYISFITLFIILVGIPFIQWNQITTSQKSIGLLLSFSNLFIAITLTVYMFVLYRDRRIQEFEWIKNKGRR